MMNPRDRYDSLLMWTWHLMVEKYGLDTADWTLLKATVAQESAFNPNAVSPAGAMGLLQLMPGTYGVYSEHTSPWNPEENLRRGGLYLGQLWKEFAMERDLER